MFIIIDYSFSSNGINIITDSLNRKWSTIGINVSDAIQVFEQGNDNVWTHIIESAMKNDYLKYDQLPNKDFIKLYAVNPIEALSVYFLETVDVHNYWEWRAVGGTSY